MKDPSPSSGPLGPSSSIAALVPHFRSEIWLADCLESLLGQTRPPDAVIVIDDASGAPPVDIVRRFGGVTLLESEANVGPYRLMQQVISHTQYDGYLFQDADDWSGPDRLGLLLAESMRTGAEFVGCQEVQIFPDRMEALPFHYPLDVNEGVLGQPGFFGLLQATSVVSRRFVMDLGGFATGLRFSGDLEFLQRAVHSGPVRNIPQFCYFRRRRRGSLTTSPDTGLQSAARLELWESLRDRAVEFQRRVLRGEQPDLSPWSLAPEVRVDHVCGPEPGGAEWH